MTGYGSMHRVFSKLSDWQHTIFLSPNLKPIPPPSVSNFSKLSEKFSSLIAILYCGQGFGPFCISTSCLIGCIYTALANHVFYFHFICSLYPPNPK